MMTATTFRPFFVLGVLLLTIGLTSQSAAQSLWTVSNAKTDQCAYDELRTETKIACIEMDQGVMSSLLEPGAFMYISVGGDEIRVDVTSATQDARGTTLLTGISEGEHHPTFHLAVHDGVAAGSFSADGALYEVRPTTSGLSVVTQVDKDQRRRVHSDAVIPDKMPVKRVMPAGLGKEAVAAQIDLLLLWDDAIEASNGSAGLAALEASFVDYLNQAVSNGGNPDIVFNVVHSEVIAYNENQFSDMADDLVSLRGQSDGILDEAHTLRVQHNADLVHLFLPSEKDFTCGIAYQSFSGVDLGFGVTAINDCGIETFAHEIGHNMGMGHDVYVSEEPDDAFQLWSYGYVDLTNAIYTIMAYSFECFDQGISCDVVPFFSDPDAQSNGIPLGIADAPPAKAANNFRVMEENAENRASYSDLLDACAIGLYGAESAATSYMQGEEVRLAFTMDNSQGHTGCTSDASVAAYLIGPNLDTYLVGRSAIALTESQAVYEVSGTMVDPVPPVGTYGVLLFEDGLSGYYDITDITGLRVEITAGSGVNTEDSTLPEGFQLTSAYPNPFNPQTTIAFDVADTRPVSIRVYDSLGRERAVLADQQVFASGAHTVRLDAANLPSGTYLIRMSVGAHSDVLPVTLFK